MLYYLIILTNFVLKCVINQILSKLKEKRL